MFSRKDRSSFNRKRVKECRFKFPKHFKFFTILRPVEFSIKFDTVKSGWHFVYIDGSKVIISKSIILILSLKIDFV